MGKQVSYGEIGSVVASFFASNVAVGQVVEVTANDTVAVPASGKSFSGVVIGVSDDGMAAVQVKGFATVMTDKDVDAGKVILVTDDDGTVAEGTSGTSYMVVTSDNTAGTAVILL